MGTQGWQPAPSPRGRRSLCMSVLMLTQAHYTLLFSTVRLRLPVNTVTLNYYEIRARAHAHGLLAGWLAGCSAGNGWYPAVPYKLAACRSFLTSKLHTYLLFWPKSGGVGRNQTVPRAQSSGLGILTTSRKRGERGVGQLRTLACG